MPLTNMYNPAPSEYSSPAQYDSQLNQEDTCPANDTHDDRSAKVLVVFNNYDQH